MAETLSPTSEPTTSPLCNSADGKIKLPVRGYMAWASLWGIFLTTLASLTTCMCGHFNLVSVPFTVPGLLLGLWGWKRAGSMRNSAQIVAGLAVIFTAIAFLKNVADVLWLGHEPLLK